MKFKEKHVKKTIAFLPLLVTDPQIIIKKQYSVRKTKIIVGQVRT